MCSGSNVHYKGKKNISISYKMAFDMDKDALFLSYSVFFFCCFCLSKKLTPTIHIQLLMVKSVKSTVCLSGMFGVKCG